MKRPDSPPTPVLSPRVLLVCSGNTCRSPLAEALARRLAPEMGLEGAEFRSAGTSTLPDLPASEGARRAALRHGLSLEGHRSTPLSRELVEWAQIVLSMGPSHVDRVRALGGGGKGTLLGVFARGGDEGDGGGGRLAVPDPFGGDEATYEETYQTLERYLALALERIRREAMT